MGKSKSMLLLENSNPKGLGIPHVCVWARYTDFVFFDFVLSGVRSGHWIWSGSDFPRFLKLVWSVCNLLDMVFQCTKTANSKFVSSYFQQCFAFLWLFCYLPYDASNHICCEFSHSALKFVMGLCRTRSISIGGQVQTLMVAMNFSLLQEISRL